MRKIVLLTALLLVGCSDGYYAVEVCRERDVVSGRCTKGEFTCTAPMVLRSTSNSTPACYMTTATP